MYKRQPLHLENIIIQFLTLLCGIHNQNRYKEHSLISGLQIFQQILRLFSISHKVRRDVYKRQAQGRKKLADEMRLAMDAKQWVDAIQEYADITELDAATLNLSLIHISHQTEHDLKLAAGMKCPVDGSQQKQPQGFIGVPVSYTHLSGRYPTP